MWVCVSFCSLSSQLSSSVCWSRPNNLHRSVPLHHWSYTSQAIRLLLLFFFFCNWLMLFLGVHFKFQMTSQPELIVTHQCFLVCFLFFLFYCPWHSLQHKSQYARLPCQLGCVDNQPAKWVNSMARSEQPWYEQSALNIRFDKEFDSMSIHLTSQKKYLMKLVYTLAFLPSSDILNVTCSWNHSDQQCNWKAVL